MYIWVSFVSSQALPTIVEDWVFYMDLMIRMKKYKKLSRTLVGQRRNGKVGLGQSGI